MKKYNIEEIGRLDKIVSNLETNLSREAVQRMIKNGKILVNGKQEKPSYKTNIGETLTIEEEKAEEIDLKPQEMPLDVIYEDDDMLVINKEKGIVVHPGNGNPDGTLANAVMARCKGGLSGIGGKIRPGIVHRIDKDTSGLVIIAKNDKAHINLSNQIQKRKVKKTYIALVRGVIKENEATINMPIGRSTKDRKKMAVSKNGKEAITNFKVLKRFTGYTLLEVNIETGRTHQIRVHLAEIGFPIVGDIVYSNGKNPFNVKGQMLHAAKLELKHPTTQKDVTFEATLPEYFKKIVKELEKQM
jgi:23S rRNA pseudouridine1911/1915/1917 synthase